VAGGGIETLAGTVSGTLRVKDDAMIHGKKVKRPLFNPSETYLQELERKRILPKGKN